MAIKTRDEIVASFNQLIGDNSSDEVLSLIEDITDTMNANNNNEYNKQRYDELDASWRQRYKERFLSGKPTDEDEEDFEDEKPKKLTYESLFKEEK